MRVCDKCGKAGDLIMVSISAKKHEEQSGGGWDLDLCSDCFEVNIRQLFSPRPVKRK